MTQHRNALRPRVRTPANVEPGVGGTGRAIGVSMANVAEIKSKLETIEGGKVWVAEQAATPHVRVYFGGNSYVAVTDEGDSYGIEFVAGDGLSYKKRQRLAAQYTAKVSAALGC